MKSFVSFAILLVGLQASAGFVAEPFLGYASGSTKATSLTGAEGSSTNTGIGFGVRAGYLFGQSFWASAEYTGGSGKDKDSGGEQDYTRTATGVVFGYKIPKYNFWAGYGVSEKIAFKSDSLDLYLSGTNMKFGFGYELGSRIYVNVELIIPTYKKFGNSTREFDISAAYSKLTASMAVISFSMPFGFGK